MAKKVLFINQEIDPYVAESHMSIMGRELPQKMQEAGFEIRTFMPKWGTINERRGQLHEVIRLSGMNLIIDDTQAAEDQVQLRVEKGGKPGLHDDVVRRGPAELLRPGVGHGRRAHLGQGLPAFGPHVISGPLHIGPVRPIVPHGEHHRHPGPMAAVDGLGAGGHRVRRPGDIQGTGRVQKAPLHVDDHQGIFVHENPSTNAIEDPADVPPRLL